LLLVSSFLQYATYKDSGLFQFGKATSNIISITYTIVNRN